MFNFLCRHNTVKVVRWHRDTVRPYMQGKQLYVDIHGFHNFIRCCKCGKFLNISQIEQLFAPKLGQNDE